MPRGPGCRVARAGRLEGRGFLDGGARTDGISLREPKEEKKNASSSHCLVTPDTEKQHSPDVFWVLIIYRFPPKQSPTAGPFLTARSLLCAAADSRVSERDSILMF